MNVTTDNFINNILLEGLYLSLLVCFLAINIYRQQILIKEIDRLKKKQDILFESIQKLKIIIDIDKEAEDIVSANVAILQNKLNDIEKRIEESESAEDRGVRGLGTQVPVKDMGSPHYIKYLDHDLKKLFGIFSDDDNETTADTLSTYLEPQSYLEPQFSFEKIN